MADQMICYFVEGVVEYVERVWQTRCRQVNKR